MQKPRLNPEDIMLHFIIKLPSIPGQNIVKQCLHLKVLFLTLPGRLRVPLCLVSLHDKINIEEQVNKQ
jgi:hypothetical protein